MLYSRVIAGSLVYVSVILTGCGGSDSDSDAGLSEVAGIWDSSGAGDIYYTVIQPDGEMKFYDYQADATGTGENCYILDSFDDEAESFAVVPNGSAYDLVLKSDEFTGIIEKAVSKSGDTLQIFELNEDSARVGSTLNTVVFSADKSVPVQSINRVTGVDVADLNLCDSTSVTQNDDPGGEVIKSSVPRLIQLLETVRELL